MGVSMEIRGTDTVPNGATLEVIQKVAKKLDFVPGISVRIIPVLENPRWRSVIDFAWEGKRFAQVVYGYGGGEIAQNDHTVCCVREVSDVSTMYRDDVIKFEPESLRKKLAELLLKKVEKEKARLQEICEKLGQKPQPQFDCHSGSGITKC